MKTKKNIGFFLLCIIFLSCMDTLDTRYITVSNKSKGSIYSIISSTDDMIGSLGFYDEFKESTGSKDSRFLFVFSEIGHGMEVENHDRPRFWDSYFDRIPDKQTRLYIVSKDSVDKYGWKKIFHDTIYNKKYKLSLQDLEKANWKIIYNE